MTHIDTIITQELELLKLSSQQISSDVAIRLKSVFEDLFFGTCILDTSGHLPKQKTHITYANRLLFSQGKNGAGEAVETTPILGSYLKAKHAITGENSISKERLEPFSRLLKGSVAACGAITWPSLATKTTQAAFDILDTQTMTYVDNMFEYSVLAGTIIGAIEKIHSINRLIQNAEE